MLIELLMYIQSRYLYTFFAYLRSSNLVIYILITLSYLIYFRTYAELRENKKKISIDLVL